VLAWRGSERLACGLDLDSIVQYDSHPRLQALGHRCSVLIESTKRRSYTASRFQPPNACFLRLSGLKVVSNAIKSVDKDREESAASRSRLVHSTALKFRYISRGGPHEVSKLET
jgi:hypothetical protein